MAKSDDESAKKVLSVRRRQLEHELDVALIESGQPTEIAELSAALKAACDAEQRHSQPRRQVLLLGLFSVLAAASLIGMGIFFRLPIVTIQVEVQATQVTLEAAETGAFGAAEAYAFTGTAPFVVENISIEGASERSSDDLNERGRSQIDGIEVYPGTRFQLSIDSPNCIAIRILESRVAEKATGVVVRVGVLPNATDDVPMPRPIPVRPGELLRFCGTPGVEAFLIGRAAAFALTRVYREESPRLESSSIVKGVLTILEISEKRTLSPNDRLILDNLNDAWLVIRREEGVFAVSLWGRATAARVMGGAPTVESENLIPSTLAYATQSPLALLLGFAAGLVGIFWNALRFLFR